MDRPGGYAPAVAVLHGEERSSREGGTTIAALFGSAGPWQLWHPTVLVAIALVATCYLRWVIRAPGRVAAAVSAGTWACGLLGLATVYVAVGSPLATLAARSLFSACMLAQVLLAFVGAPLLLCGLPGGLLQPIVRRARLVEGIRLVTHPVPATLLFHLLFGAFFIPAVFDAVLASRALYVAVAILLTLLAMCMWWPVASPLPDVPRLAEPAQLIYLLANWLAILVAFALVLFGSGLPYRTYATAMRPPGMTPTLDRQLAGAVLGVLSHLAYGIAIAVAFFRWATTESATATPSRLYRRLLAGGFTEAQAARIAGVPKDGP